MRLFNGIIGVLSLFGMIYCIFWPEATFLNVGWIIALILFLWGFCSVITYLIDKKQGHKNRKNFAYGSAGLFLSIVLCVISIISMMVPKVAGSLLLIVLISFILFLLVAGIRNIIFAARSKKFAKKKGRVAKLVVGIIQLLLVALGLVGWFVDINAASLLIGIMLGLFGCTLIASMFIGGKDSKYEVL